MWNERFSGTEYVFGTQPAAFVQRAAPYIKPGQTALAVADGEGRNSVWLAQQGLKVTAFDFAENGLQKGRALAARRGVQVDFQLADITRWDWDAVQYDLVVAIFIQFMGPAQRAKVFEGLSRAVKPGGLVLLHGYAPRQVDYGTGGPGAAENMYTIEMLQQAFEGFDLLHLGDYDAEIDEGRGHSGRSALVDLIARKP